ncbi:hypothetical protein ES705_16985 [subsurface metagenome]
MKVNNTIGDVDAGDKGEVYGEDDPAGTRGNGFRDLGIGRGIGASDRSDRAWPSDRMRDGRSWIGREGGIGDVVREKGRYQGRSTSTTADDAGSDEALATNEGPGGDTHLKVEQEAFREREEISGNCTISVRDMELGDFLDFATWKEEEAMNLKYDAGDAAPGLDLEAFGWSEIEPGGRLDTLPGKVNEGNSHRLINK